ncbi:hypothetical protein HETIRDRAFT_474540, partial [Heterobasidion irregulare TC 32-1]
MCYIGPRERMLHCILYFYHCIDYSIRSELDQSRIPSFCPSLGYLSCDLLCVIPACMLRYIDLGLLYRICRSLVGRL